MSRLKRWLGLGGPPPVIQVLMVCSGNICRSPTAEAVLRAKLQAAGLADRIAVDSAGTHGFHIKEPPDPRAQALGLKRGYDLSRLRARRVAGEDFVRFQRILAMDQGHLKWLTEAAPPDARARVGLLMSHAVRHAGVPRYLTRTTAPSATSNGCSTWSRTPATAWCATWRGSWLPRSVPEYRKLDQNARLPVYLTESVGLNTG